MKFINSIVVYLLFCFAFIMGLSVNSTVYRQEIESGNLLYLPFFMMTYSIPNWIGVSILAVMVGRISKKQDTAMVTISDQWQESIFMGMLISISIIFGGSCLNVDQILRPTQEDYFRIVGLIIVVAFGQQKLQSQPQT